MAFSFLYRIYGNDDWRLNCDFTENQDRRSIHMDSMFWIVYENHLIIKNNNYDETVKEGIKL